MEVQIKNTSDQKLKKEFQLVIPAKLIDSKTDEHIAKIKEKVNLKGFRKGMVPASVVKEKYGDSIAAEESDKIINETIQKIIKDNKLKLAITPKVDVKEFDPKKDIEVNAVMEIFPEVPKIDFKKIKLTKKEPKITDDDIQEALEKLTRYHKKWTAKEPNEKAKTGDAVKIDYVGAIDGEEFEGGSAKDYQLELGSKSFIDDFESQLTGKRAGDEVKVKVKFPKDYHNDNFASKAAVFQVKIHQVLKAEELIIDDKFVKENFKIDTKEKLLEELKKQIETNYQNITKNLFKKDLYDLLDKKFKFDLPEGLVQKQLDSLWQEVEAEIKSNPNKFKNDKEKNKAKEKKREIACRMILCGMILAEIANENKIEATNEDLNQQFGQILSRYPGQQKEILELYQKNPEAIQQIKGTIVEDKTIDFIIEQGSIDKKESSLKDLDKSWKKANEAEY